MFADELNASIEAIDKGRGQTLIRDALATGMRPEEVAGYLKDAIAQMLKKYEEGEYFIADLIMMGEVIAGFYQLVRPTDADVIPSGKLVIGTIFDDIHDVGKNIFCSLARSAGFTVVDLGIDVPVGKFIQAIERENPDILGVSAVLSTTLDNVKVLVDALETQGLRERVKVILGGAVATPDCVAAIGCDASTMDAVEGLSQCIAWMKVQKVED
ncbi:MAG: cobalamin-dependent protein [Eubacterium aggregans]|uniref:cobalamin B12-binding domain-containing protein n=1 Tax=Eubacterium aggregans TaxID=81409 RepID=UPI0023F210D4|nr:cobalamin-dependent protein [Eubacterium aggregans]MDD4690723.1 cobalamin-dependent protein [Eubacterium aggregans]MEA5072606.1 cobalamin-dependent protein [Eubacterium aggregans]